MDSKEVNEFCQFEGKAAAKIRPLPKGKKNTRGLSKDPMIQKASSPWMGGLWGREGVHPG